MPESATAKLIQWIEENLGGKVQSIEIQPGWRPGWFIELNCGDKVVSLYARGARGEQFPKHSIDYEQAVYTVLGNTDIPVPHCYGICADPYALIMERVPGHYGVLDHVQNEEQRLALMNNLAEITARMHALDPQPFIDAGVIAGSSGMAARFPHWHESEELYLAHKQTPDPVAEFMRAWVHSNMPAAPERLSFIHGDPGQFLFEGNRITGMIDFELAGIGDPMVDIATLRGRAVYEPMGDITPFYQRYAELTGRTLDRTSMVFYLVVASSATHLLVSDILRSNRPSRDSLEYLGWYAFQTVQIMKEIARLRGYELTDPGPLEPEAPRWVGLIDTVEAHCANGEDYQAQLALKYLPIIRRIAALGPLHEADYVRDVEQFLGRRLNGWREADFALDEYIQAEGNGREAELVQLFYAWGRRQVDLITGMTKSDTQAAEMVPLSVFPA